MGFKEDETIELKFRERKTLFFIRSGLHARG